MSTSDAKFKGVLDMRKITSCLVAVSLSSALVLSGCAAAPVVGVVGHESTSDVELVQPTTATMSDKEVSDFDELARAQEPLGVAAGTIEEQFPGDYAYAFFEQATLHVGFKSKAPEAAVAMLTATGGRYVVTESAGFNAAEYQAAMDDVMRQIQEYAPAEPNVSVGQNPSLERGAIVVGFPPGDKNRAGDPGLADALKVDPRFRIIFDYTDAAAIADF